MTPIAAALALVDELTAMRRLSTVEASVLRSGLWVSTPVIGPECLAAALEAGVEAAISAAGTQRRLAEQLGITRAAVGQWDVVPSSRVADVERATGVPRHVLRPDLYRAA